MATFKKGDWVEITPKPDTKSKLWDEYVHNRFCGEIGFIHELAEEDDQIIVNVCVWFEDGVFSKKGYRYAWFENKHLILSSEWEANRKTSLREEFQEYLKIEEKIKKRRDEILSEIFTPEELKREKQEEENRLMTDEEFNNEDMYGSFDIFDLYKTSP